ncbi:MAG: molybdopterin molybdotransferase MoeA [Coriobacteriales bacterium]|jgi:molybdopterin molybdotransferase
MRDHSKHIELKREEAIEKLIEVSAFQPRTETVDLHEALGRVTAGECPSKYDLPNALCAQMDGIAVHFDDFADGIPDVTSWEYGKDYDWANTGTAMPEGFDTSIAIERCEFTADGKLSKVNAAPDRRGANCKQPGDSFHKGDVIVGARERLTPTKISALAMCGYTDVEVIVKPRVVFIPTGDELVPMGQELPHGKSYETNGILLEQKMLLWGAEPVIYPCLPDDWDQIKAAIIKACGEADIVSINAGSSKGSKDFTMEILEEIGTVFCHETNHGPGHHTSASVVDGTPVLGLSGPPGGCEITADWYLKPLIDQYLYGAPVAFTTVTAQLTEPIAGHKPGGPAGRPDMLKGKKPAGGPGKDFFAIKPVTLEFTSDGIKATPVKGKGHLNLVQLDTADGYLEMNPRKFGELKPGSTVQIELRYPYTAK